MKVPENLFWQIMEPVLIDGSKHEQRAVPVMSNWQRFAYILSVESAANKYSSNK